MTRPAPDHPVGNKTGTDTIPDHGIPPEMAQGDAKGMPTDDRHRTEHAVVTGDAQAPAEPTKP